MSNERIANLRLRAKDEFSGSFAKLEAAQKKIAARNKELAQQPPGQLRKFYQDIQREIEGAQGKIRSLTAEFKNLSQAEGDNRAAMGALLIEKGKLQAKAAELQNSLKGVRQAQHQLKTEQQGSFKAFNQTATAMEREAAAARKLAQARGQAADRLRSLVQSRADSPVTSGFKTWSADAEIKVVAEQERRAEIAAQRRADAQQRLNNQAKSGFGDWSRYADTISRIATIEERATAIEQRKIAIRERLNQTSASGFAAWSRSAAGLNIEATAASKVATQLNLVDTASRRAADSQARLRSQVNTTAGAMERQQRELRKRGDSGGRRGADQDVEVYGLRPDQLVNLGYQVNDVISGLAMGQAPLQILAQQAGQFAQIWPDVMVGLVRSIPVLGAVSVAVAPFVAALVRMRSEAQTVKQFASSLSLLADGGRYTAEGLAKIVTELDRAGVAVDKAREGVFALVKDGFDEGEIRGLSELARNLSAITKLEFGDEVQRLGTAFSGNASSVRELDKELQFLTADQLANIYALDKAGKSSEAMALAQDALRSKLASARQELTPWQQALKDLGETWNNLVELIADSTLFTDFIRDINTVAKDLERLARAMKLVSEKINSVINPSDAQKQERLLARRVALERELAALDRNDFAYNMNAQVIAEELADVNRELAEVEARQTAAAEAARQTAAANAETSRISEERAKNELEQQLLIDGTLEKMRMEAELAGQTSREQHIQNKLLEAKNAAIERGTKLTEEQIEALREQAGVTYDAVNSASATGNYGSIVDRIVGVESGGNATAKNPLSSATGLGQFIESTWLSMFQKHFPERAANMTRGAILALRNDAAVSRQMIENYARENSEILKAAGVSVNDAAVYLAHFLGPKGAIATLTASPNAPTSSFLGADQINANASILQGKNAAEVIAWAQKKMQMTDAEVAATQRLVSLDQQRAEDQKNYAEGYRERIADQKFELENAARSARQAAIAKAIRDEELKAQEAGVQLTAEHRAEIERTTAALFDQQNAETQVNQLLERRTQLAESLRIAQETGDRSRIEGVVEQIAQTEDQLDVAIDNAIAFYQAMGGDAADAAILKLQNMRAGITDLVRDMQTQFLPAAEEINEQLADIGGDAFSALAEALATGQNAAQSFFQVLRQGLADFSIELGKAIVKQALFNALTAGGGGGGGIGGTISSWVAGIFHGGGQVGQPSQVRMVDPAIFANASRRHTGGLASGEVPIIALKDEEVLTRDDPRHVLNGGKGGSPSNTKVVNVFDAADVLEAALETTAGEKIIMNFMSRNARKIGGALS